jgi:hypothetical protein
MPFCAYLRKWHPGFNPPGTSNDIQLQGMAGFVCIVLEWVQGHKPNNN